MKVCPNMDGHGITRYSFPVTVPAHRPGAGVAAPALEIARIDNG
ncbi:hypothetical protein [Parasphingorhabdus sp.]